MKDYYKILEINKDATQDEIKKAYRKLSIKWHPDKFSTESEEKQKEAEEKFKDISEAYSILSDENKRKQYDSGTLNQTDLNEFINNAFKNFWGTDRKQYTQITILVTLKEIAHKSHKKFKLKLKKTCSHCNGTGAFDEESIIICKYCNGTGVFTQTEQTPFGTTMYQTTCPNCQGHGTIIKKYCEHCKGTGLEIFEEIIEFDVNSSNYIRIPQKGNIINNQRQDLIIIFEEIYDPEFKRYNNYIIHDIKINLLDAIFGKEIEIPTLYGNQKYTIKSGTQYNDEYLLKGFGLNGSNQVGKIIFDIPDISKEELIQQINDYNK